MTPIYHEAAEEEVLIVRGKEELISSYAAVHPLSRDIKGIFECL